MGTGAAEGWPAAFCKCIYCTKAWELGGKNMRKRTCTMIDDNILIDLGPDLLSHAHNHKLDLSLLDAIIITHSHSDHLYPVNIEMANYPFASFDKKIKIYANKKSIEKIIFYNENEQTISQINDAEKNIMLSFVQEDLNNLKIIRERYFDANQNTISTIQKLTGTSDEDLELTLQDIDEGKVDDRKKIEESPISLPKTIYDVLNVNDAIKEQKTLIQSLE